MKTIRIICRFCSLFNARARTGILRRYCKIRVQSSASVYGTSLHQLAFWQTTAERETERTTNPQSGNSIPAKNIPKFTHHFRFSVPESNLFTIQFPVTQKVFEIARAPPSSMAGWFPFSDGPPPDPLQVLHNLQSNAGEDLKLRHLMNRILSAFLKEIRLVPPAVLGDGRSVDLFKLYWAVRQKGGYDSVTANGSWGPVMEEAGLGGSGAGPFVRAIYLNYLDGFDRWLQRISEQVVVGSMLSDAGLETTIKRLLRGPQEYPELSLGKNDVRKVARGNSRRGKSTARVSFCGAEQFPDLGFGRNESESRKVGRGGNARGRRGLFCGSHQLPELALGRNDVQVTVRGNGHVGQSAMEGRESRKLGFDLNEVQVMTDEIEHVGDGMNAGPLNVSWDFLEIGSDKSGVRVAMTTEIGHRVGHTANMDSLCGAHQSVSERKEDWRMVRGNSNLDGSVVTSVAGNTVVDDDSDEVVVLDSSVANGEFVSLKRKRELEYLLGMVDWVKRIAKNPGDSDFAKIVEESRGKVIGIDEHWARALVARKLLLEKRQACSNTEGSILQKRQKMHPSMYEDSKGADHNTNRCNQRITLQRSYSVSCLEAPSISNSNVNKCPIPHVEASKNDPNKRVLRTVGSLTAQKVVDLFCKDQLPKRVPVGPFFQAQVPEWTGVTSSYPDDPKWLGTQHWPPQLGEEKSTAENLHIGKGRSDSCSCHHRGSIECVRFHVTEKRLQVRAELGAAFYEWRFDGMGEDVSLSWTVEDEGIFEAIANRNSPYLTKTLWDPAYGSFCSKSRQSLVSYYFNVFLLRRRSHQNRLTPNHTDSDDEDSGIGSMGNGFGRYTIMAGGSHSILCGQNKQCVDLNRSINVE